MYSWNGTVSSYSISLERSYQIFFMNHYYIPAHISQSSSCFLMENASSLFSKKQSCNVQKNYALWLHFFSFIVMITFRQRRHKKNYEYCTNGKHDFCVSFAHANIIFFLRALCVRRNFTLEYQMNGWLTWAKNNMHNTAARGKEHWETLCIFFEKKEHEKIKLSLFLQCGVWRWACLSYKLLVLHKCFWLCVLLPL